MFGSVKCDAQTCETSLPAEIQVGSMKISLAGMQSAHAPAGVPKDVMVPGMAPEINLPASILRNYEVVFDYANRQFTIGEPGSVKFEGAQVSARVNPAGLLAVTGQVQGEKLNFSLNTGSPISLLAADRLAKWHAANVAWPYLRGAVGAANVTGDPDETARELLRVPGLHVGTSELSGIVFASLPSTTLQRLSDRIGADTNGQLGGEAFRSSRLGIDYAHQAVYLDAGHAAAPDMDVLGLTLHPEADGRFTVVGVVEIDGKPAVADVKSGDVLVGVDGAPATGATLGQVWSLLGGAPGQKRALTLEREGKRLTVDAPVRRLLAVKAAAPVKSPRRNPHRRN
jgi:PDZ domain